MTPYGDIEVGCLMAPIPYLNQCWLLINGFCGIHKLKKKSSFSGNTHIWKMSLKMTFLKLLPHGLVSSVTKHFLSQCWPRFMSPYGIARPQWIKSLTHWSLDKTYKMKKKPINLIFWSNALKFIWIHWISYGITWPQWVHHSHTIPGEKKFYLLTSSWQIANRSETHLAAS